MEEVELDPQEIRFTHNTVYPAFKDGRRLNDTIDGLRQGFIQIEDIPKIRVVFFKGCYWSLDNRRLLVFKTLQIPSIKCFLCERDDQFARKFTTTSKNGKDIIVLGNKGTSSEKKHLEQSEQLALRNKNKEKKRQQLYELYKM